MDGPVGRLQDGDLITIDALAGTLSTEAPLAQRDAAPPPAVVSARGLGRELFDGFRNGVGPAEQGASQFASLLEETA